VKNFCRSYPGPLELPSFCRTNFLRHVFLDLLPQLFLAEISFFLWFPLHFFFLLPPFSPDGSGFVFIVLFLLPSAVDLAPTFLIPQPAPSENVNNFSPCFLTWSSQSFSSVFYVPSPPQAQTPSFRNSPTFSHRFFFLSPPRLTYLPPSFFWSGLLFPPPLFPLRSPVVALELRNR